MTSFMIVLLLEFSKLGMKNYCRSNDSNFMNLLSNKLCQMHFKPKKNAEYELRLLTFPFSNKGEYTMSPVLSLVFSAKLRTRVSAQCPPLYSYQLVLTD